MQRCLRFRHATCLALCCVSLALLVPAPALAALNRRDAVQAAREGRLDVAITELAALEAAGDPLARQDLVVVLGWAGRWRDSIAAYERINGAGHVPDYVQRAAASAYRGERRFAEAEALARAVLVANPLDAEAAMLLAGVLTDSGRAAEAMALMEGQVQRQGGDAQQWIALGNAARALPDPFGALRAFGQARMHDPGNAEAAASLSAVLRDLDAPFGAAMQSTPVPLALRAAQAGRLVRWAGQFEPLSPARRFEAADSALAEIDRLLAESHAMTDADLAARGRLRLDRLVALRLRERWADTADGAAALRAEGVVLPAYARQAEADALLALQQPERALVAYLEVLAAEPGNREARIGRFYAEVEVEDFAAAFASAEALGAGERESRSRPLDPVPRPNPDWLDARMLAANARGWTDMHAEAWRLMNPLVEGAPSLAWARSSRAALAATRGWPRWADKEMRIVATMAPDDRGVQLGLADSAMRRARWEEARPALASLQAAYPQDAAVQRSARDLAAHDMAEIDAGVTLRKENGNSPNAPGNGIDAYLHFYTPPIAELWRGVVAAERQSATPPEGSALRIRHGAGLEYRGADLRFDVMAWSNQGTLDKSGIGVRAAWLPNDHLRLDVDAESFAVDTPLRALIHGITADAAGAAASYTWHESASVSIGWRGMDFSDGNRRNALSLNGRLRVLAQPRVKIDLMPALYRSTNSLQGVPYFNPVSDRSMALSLRTEQLLWRRYERSFGHELTLTGGSYWQQDYGTGSIGSLRYQQAWRNDPRTSLNWGVEIRRAIYDGVPERSANVFLNLNHRF
jgi:biofilm PGA synthesis protein PgaA